MLPAATSCSIGFQRCVLALSTNVTLAPTCDEERRRPRRSPSRVTSSSPAAPPPTTTILCTLPSPTRRCAFSPSPPPAGGDRGVRGPEMTESGITPLTLLSPPAGGG